MNTGGRGDFELRIVREFNAQPAAVFEQWSNPDYVASWFAPDGHTVTTCDFLPAEGNSWSVTYVSEVGSCTEAGEFLEVDPPNCLVFTLSQTAAEGVAVSGSVVIVTFEATLTGTRMLFRQSGFDTAQRRDDHVIGWNECFDKLNANLDLRSASQP